MEKYEKINSIDVR